MNLILATEMVLVVDGGKSTTNLYILRVQVASYGIQPLLLLDEQSSRTLYVALMLSTYIHISSYSELEALCVSRILSQLNMQLTSA